MLGYLDPGTGSVIIQGLLGGVAGLAVVGKMFGRSFLSVVTFGRYKGKPSASTEADDTVAEEAPTAS